MPGNRQSSSLHLWFSLLIVKDGDNLDKMKEKAMHVFLLGILAVKGLQGELSESEFMHIVGRMPTKIELTLEQSQQGVSNDVLAETGSKHNLFINHKMIVDIEERRHRPSDAMHNPSKDWVSLKRTTCLICHGYTRYLLDISLPEIVNVEIGGSPAPASDY
ncbi:hypothetical protein Tco_1577946 [Tanacetum coccineum]